MSSETLPISPARFAAALKDLPLSSLHLKVLELRNSIAHLDYSNEQLRPYAEGTAVALSSSPTTSSAPPQPTTASQQLNSTTTTTTLSDQQHQQPNGTFTQSTRAPPDQDCLDAMRENEQVIARMQERIRLVRAEVEGRGLSWVEFQGAVDSPAEGAAENRQGGGEGDGEGADGGEQPAVNGDVSGHGHGLVNGTADGHSRRQDQQQERGGEGGGRHSAWTDGTFQTGVIRDGAVQMDSVAGSRRGGAEQGSGGGGSLTDEELRRRVEEQLRNLGGDEEEDGEGGLHL